ncbi:MAG: flagellar basal body L-ring protein FlgH [Nitrospirae bacterium]|nr:flagellar basal body L-ring protein FlgH [Nitrospirota bacterium]
MKTLLMIMAIFSLLASYGCQSPASKLPTQSSKYYYGGDSEKRPQDGSLYTDTASLYEDRRARRLNDIVTINISESVTADNKDETDGTKTSTLNEGVTGLFNLTSATLGLTGGVGSGGQVNTSAKDSYTGKGETKQDAKFTATIAAKVIEVLPNGNLVIDSRKEVTINYERKILVLQGIIRPDDVDSNNAVASSKVADARMYLVGDGYLQELQSPGWLVRLWNKVSPF